MTTATVEAVRGDEIDRERLVQAMHFAYLRLADLPPDPRVDDVMDMMVVALGYTPAPLVADPAAAGATPAAGATEGATTA